MTQKNNKKTISRKPQQKVKVMYQNLGGVWYAFTKVKENVFFGRVPTQVSAQGISPEFKARVERAFDEET